MQMFNATMTLARQKLGELGEKLARAELEARGYAVLAIRYRTRHGEIDIVADDGGTLVFVEVRVKSSPEFGSAAESVTPDKQRRVVRMALEYLLVHNVRDRPCRFDVVAIDLVEGEPHLALIQGAFDGV